MGRTERTLPRENSQRPSRQPHRPQQTAMVEGKGLTGKVSKIVADKGFGFIDGDNGVKYFFHHSVCLPSNRGTFNNLYEGEKVCFDGIRSEKGPRCEMVTSVENADPAEREAARENQGNRITE